MSEPPVATRMSFAQSECPMEGKRPASRKAAGRPARFSSLVTKISIMAFVMVMLGTLAVGIFSYALYRKDTIDSHAQEALSVAQAVASAIDTEAFRQEMDSGLPGEQWEEMVHMTNQTLHRTGAAHLYILDKNYGDKVTYYVDGEYLDDGEIALGAHESVDDHSQELFETLRLGQARQTRIYDSGAFGMMVSGFAPIVDDRGIVQGVVGVDINVDRVMSVANGFGLIILVIAVVASAVFGQVIMQVIRRMVGRPIAMLIEASEKMSKGDMDIHLAVESEDEIGQLTASFQHMSDSTREQIRILETIADGDLVVEVKQRSEQDSMAIAMKRMATNLMDMVREIQKSTEQVSLGTRQIADGAQVLAESSMEQATAVGQLSSSIQEVAGKTEANAEMARTADQMSNKIMAAAQAGTQQMERMMQAVQAIGDAGSEIGKVIKAIDDIAFQTNILALNAAVEAARAGQHGKGFAVVADEVRNLASKSAEAAKDTSVLIEDSIEKAQLGVRIAQETAQSLNEIVVGIGESDRIISQIPQASEEQKVQIEQIRTGIEQVTNIVHQNSATAEQSAAASVEMRGQVQSLRQMVSQFRVN